MHIRVAVVASLVLPLVQPLGALDTFIRSDVNADGAVNVADAVAVLKYLYMGEKILPCLAAADTNDDGVVNGADGALLLSSLFAARSVVTVDGRCLRDPTPSGLPCASSGCASRIKPTPTPPIGDGAVHETTESGDLGVDQSQGTPPRGRRLVLAHDARGIQLLWSQPNRGNLTPEALKDERRLSFDVFTLKGGFVFTRAVRHPLAGRLEVFEHLKKGGIHRLHPRRSEVFAIKIPNVPGGTIVKFYDAAAGVDLDTPEGRKTRRFISQIEVNVE